MARSSYNVEFKVLDLNFPSILRLLTAIKLNLIKYIYMVDEQNTAENNSELYEKYQDIFDGLGCVK